MVFFACLNAIMTVEFLYCDNPANLIEITKERGNHLYCFTNDRLVFC